MQNNKRQNHRDNNAQLVDRSHTAGLAHLQGLVVKQPRTTGRQSGQGKEYPAFGADCAYAALFSQQEDHAPCHHEHHSGSDSSSKRAVHVFHADFG